MPGRGVGEAEAFASAVASAFFSDLHEAKREASVKAKRRGSRRLVEIIFEVKQPRERAGKLGRTL
jgi:hypothetical protein